jgi:hypothetical protein
MTSVTANNEIPYNAEIELMDLVGLLNIRFKMLDLIQNLLDNRFIGGPVVPAGMNANDTCLCTSKMIELVMADCRELIAEAVQSVSVSVSVSVEEAGT